jgi:hypothetical protein
MSTNEPMQTPNLAGADPEPGILLSAESLDASQLYRIWACDNQVYGPIPLSILVEWIRDSRVLRDTWIYVESLLGWYQAHKIPVLKDTFSPGEDTMFLHRQSIGQNAVDPYELRLFPALTNLSNHDLAHFIQLSELVLVNPGDFIIRRREPGDAIFFVLTGSVRARILVGSEEKLLSRIPAGQFLGEMSMFTQTVRTADVIAEEQTRLLRFTAESFQTLITEHPAAAAPMLYAISATMAQRILDTNNKFQTEVTSGFAWR